MYQTPLTVKELLKKYQAGERDFSRIKVTDANLLGANLSGAYLVSASLKEACLRGAYLVETDLSQSALNEANLIGAILTDASLIGANLTQANLADANLVGANLAGANLSLATFVGANLTGANLVGVKPPFQSHVFWGELLAQKATNREQQALACMVAEGERFEWCWSDFLSWNHPLQDWALEAIKSFELDLVNCPSRAAILRR